MVERATGLSAGGAGLRGDRGRGAGLPDDWWTPLVGALRDEATGGIFAYSDERQRVFARFGRSPLALVPLVLDRHQLRPSGTDLDAAAARGRP